MFLQKYNSIMFRYIIFSFQQCIPNISRLAFFGIVPDESRTNMFMMSSCEYDIIYFTPNYSAPLSLMLCNRLFCFITDTKASVKMTFECIWTSGVARFLEALVQSFGGGSHEPPWTPGMKSWVQKTLDNFAIYSNSLLLPIILNNNLLFKKKFPIYFYKKKSFYLVGLEAKI